MATSNNGFKRRVEDELKGLFFTKGFQSKLEKSSYLIAFTKGVYDLNKNEFRNGQPDDCLISMLGVEYKEPVTKESDELDVYLAELIVDSEISDCVLKLVSKTLYGKNKNSRFIFLVGIASIGKSTFMTLLKRFIPSYLAVKDARYRNLRDGPLFFIGGVIIFGTCRQFFSKE